MRITGPYGETISDTYPASSDAIDVTKAGGRLVRGVVVATYVFDEQPCATTPPTNFSSGAIFCDVIAYSGTPGSRIGYLPRCLVAQERSGLHDGDVWVPRPATTMLDGSPLNPNHVGDPAQADGDHVLVGFIDDNTMLPVILRSVPHPSIDSGNDLPSAVDIPGHRLQIYASEGRPRFWRHKGAFFGVSKEGDFEIDLSRAYPGDYEFGQSERGREPDPPLNGSTGNYRVRVPTGSTVTLEVVSDPDNPGSGTTAQLIMEDDKVTLNIQNGELNVVAQDVKLGDGASEAAVLGDSWKSAHDTMDSKINTLFQQLQTLATSLANYYVPPSGPPPTQVSAAIVGAIWHLFADPMYATQASAAVQAFDSASLLSDHVTVRD